MHLSELLAIATGSDIGKGDIAGICVVCGAETECGIPLKYKNGKRFVGTELNHKRLAVLLERIVNMGGTYKLIKYSPCRPASLPTTASSLFSGQDIRHDCRQL